MNGSRSRFLKSGGGMDSMSSPFDFLLRASSFLPLFLSFRLQAESLYRTEYGCINPVQIAFLLIWLKLIGKNLIQLSFRLILDRDHIIMNTGTN